MGPHFTVRSKVRLFPGHGGWHYVTVDKRKSKIIRENFADPLRGWGSVPVRVMLGKTEWKTSIFYMKKQATYLLGLKADVRKTERVKVGDLITFSIQIREV